MNDNAFRDWLDGMLAARFDANCRGTEFREWWHRQETAV